MDVTSIALSPAMWLVNPITVFQSIPAWLGFFKAPGLGSENIPGLNRWRADLEELRTKPFSLAKVGFSNGLFKNSYVSSLLAEGTTGEQSIVDTAAVAFGACYETTVISGDVFILAMVLYPEVQKRAQDEIDRIVGNDRLPDFSDRETLPYITALMKEVLRWHPPAPTGIPHMLREDDMYREYHIPEGAVLIGNIWMVAQILRESFIICIVPGTGQVHS
ncbi:cytochrome P450 [Dichomitus squalens]|uniref:Cytochrome P450 n=1 Tax=Dichomitus squalens TaxID=114155 RepID=A0A4Q9PVK5_9APHY|nr:cytochrome P450 [Dichomitus squalens]